MIERTSAWYYTYLGPSNISPQKERSRAGGMQFRGFGVWGIGITCRCIPGAPSLQVILILRSEVYGYDSMFWAISSPGEKIYQDDLR